MIVFKGLKNGSRADTNEPVVNTTESDILRGPGKPLSLGSTVNVVGVGGTFAMVHAD